MPSGYDSSLFLCYLAFHIIELFFSLRIYNFIFGGVVVMVESRSNLQENSDGSIEYSAIEAAEVESY